MEPYWRDRSSLTVQTDLLLFNHHIVIPLTHYRRRPYRRSILDTKELSDASHKPSPLSGSLLVFPFVQLRWLTGVRSVLKKRSNEGSI